MHGLTLKNKLKNTEEIQVLEKLELKVKQSNFNAETASNCDLIKVLT